MTGDEASKAPDTIDPLELEPMNHHPLNIAFFNSTETDTETGETAYSIEMSINNQVKYVMVDSKEPFTDEEREYAKELIIRTAASVMDYLNCNPQLYSITRRRYN